MSPQRAFKQISSTEWKVPAFNGGSAKVSMHPDYMPVQSPTKGCFQTVRRPGAGM